MGRQAGELSSSDDKPRRLTSSLRRKKEVERLEEKDD